MIRHSHYNNLPLVDGTTLASFATPESVRAFAGKYGGKVLRFDEVTMDMGDLTGGAEHGETM